MMFKLGSSMTIDNSTGNLPQMGNVLSAWLQRMVISKITKKQVGYQTVEEKEDFSFEGVWQPMGQTQLRIKEEGQRNWPWYVCHSKTALPLKFDDLIEKSGVKYRVRDITYWKDYGYYEYHAVEAWVFND